MIRALVVYTRAAQSDIQDIYEAVLLKTGSVAAADGYVSRLEERCLRIGNVPRGARLRDDLQPGIRIVPFETTLAIVYRFESGVVEITNIFSTRRDYEALLRGEPPQADDDLND